MSTRYYSKPTLRLKPLTFTSLHCSLHFMLWVIFGGRSSGLLYSTKETSEASEFLLAVNDGGNEGPMEINVYTLQGQQAKKLIK